jgi:MFS transporter, DHA2 family, methylenomycin A resistance protein
MSSNEPGRPARSPRPSVREWIAVFATGSAFFMTVLDTSVVNLALPAVARDLQLSLVGLQWVVDGYTMVFASFLLGAGALGDRYGAKRLFLAGLALFAFASGLCVLAQGSMTLQVARLLQGLGAAMLLPASLAVLSHTVKDPKRRMRAISAWAAAGALGMALGPVIGGISVEFSAGEAFLRSIFPSGS